MSKIKKVSLIAIILVIIGVSGSVLTFKMPSDRSNWQMINEEFDTDLVEDIIVSADNANIEFVSHDEKNIKVNTYGNNPKDDVVISMEGDILFIRLKHPNNKLFQFDLFSSISSLKVFVPDKYFSSIQIESNNGRIKGEGFSAHEIQTKTNNGLIQLSSLESEHTSAETDNGKITFENVMSDIYGETNNGAISLRTEDIERNITLKTDIGVIDIKTNKKPLNAEISAHVDIGSISIFGHSNTNTTFGNNEYQINLSTDIGQIKVK